MSDDLLFLRRDKMTLPHAQADVQPHLTQLVKELGGEVENALTVTVTHVVAKDYGSAKYNVS